MENVDLNWVGATNNFLTNTCYVDNIDSQGNNGRKN